MTRPVLYILVFAILLNTCESNLYINYSVCEITWFDKVVIMLDDRLRAENDEPYDPTKYFPKHCFNSVKPL